MPIARIAIRVSVLISSVVLALLIGWNYYGESVLNPTYMLINLIIAIIAMLLIEKLLWKTVLVNLLKEYGVVILILLGIYCCICLNQMLV